MDFFFLFNIGIFKKANQKTFMTKELNQEIMVRSKLRNKFLRL